MVLTNDQNAKLQQDAGAQSLDKSSGPSVPADTEIGLKIHRILSAVRSGNQSDMVTSAVDLMNEGRPSAAYAGAIDALNSCLASNQIPGGLDPKDGTEAVDSNRASNLIGLACALGSAYEGPDKEAKQEAVFKALAVQSSLGVSEQDPARLSASINALSLRLTGIPDGSKIPRGSSVTVPQNVLPEVVGSMMDVLTSTDVDKKTQQAARRIVQGIDKNALVSAVESEVSKGNFEGVHQTLRLLRGMAQTKTDHAKPSQEALEALGSTLSSVVTNPAAPEQVREFAAKAIVDSGPNAFKHAHALIVAAKNKLTSATAVQRLLKTDPESLSPQNFTPDAIRSLGQFVSYKFTVTGKHADPEGLIATTRQRGLKILQKAGQDSLAALPGLTEGVEKQRLSLGQLLGTIRHTSTSSEQASPGVLASVYPTVVNMLTRPFTTRREADSDVAAQDRQSSIDTAKATFGRIAVKSIDMLKDQLGSLFSACRQGNLSGNMLGGILHYGAGKLDREILDEALPETGYQPEQAGMSPQAENQYARIRMQALQNLGPDGVNELFDRLASTHDSREKAVIIGAIAKYPEYLPGSENPDPANASKIAAAEVAVDRIHELIDYLPESREEVNSTSVQILKALREYDGDGFGSAELRRQVRLIKLATTAVEEKVADLSRESEPEFLDDAALDRSLSSRIEEFNVLHGDYQSYTPEVFKEMEEEARASAPEDVDAELQRIEDIKAKLKELHRYEKQLQNYEMLAANLGSLYDRVDYTLLYAPTDDDRLDQIA